MEEQGARSAAQETAGFTKKWTYSQQSPCALCFLLHGPAPPKGSLPIGNTNLLHVGRISGTSGAAQLSRTGAQGAEFTASTGGEVGPPEHTSCPCSPPPLWLWPLSLIRLDQSHQVPSSALPNKGNEKRK